MKVPLNFAGFLVVGLCLCFALPVAAQHIGVLQSAETMDRGTFKLTAAPIMVFGEDGADDEFGFSARGGYGFTDRFDAEAKLGIFENSTYLGADGEWWLMQGNEEVVSLDFSLAGGIHWMFGSEGHSDIMGFDVTPLLSMRVNRSLELCGAVNVSFESVQDAPGGAEDTFTTLHVVPGFEYRLSDSLDLVGEVGIALNDDSCTYAGVGIAYYTR